MARTIAPAINVASTRYEVIVSSDRSHDTDDAAALRRYTEGAIHEGDQRLTAAAKPEISVRMELALSDAQESWDQETDVEYQKTGTKQEWNDKKNKYETVDVYEYVDVTTNVKSVSATVNGSYKITDARGAELDSGTFEQQFSNKYDDGAGAPDLSSLTTDLLQKVARTVAARIVPTHDSVLVIVPKGSFEKLIPLADSGAWDRYLAGVEAVPENKSPDQEAYRQYALAIAKEAVAYVTADVPRATELMRQSVDHYKLAIADNPKEKIFSDGEKSIFFKSVPAPAPRAEQSLVQYQAWAKPPVGSVASQTQVARSTRPKTMRNKTVIQMTKAGLSDQTIEMAIDSGVATKFDVTPAGLDALAKGGVSKPVVAYMQNKTKK